MSTTDQLEAIERRLAAIQSSLAGGPAVTPLTAVNPDGTPGTVAAGELIESAWGNATANSINHLWNLPVEWRHIVTSIPASSAISTTPWDLQSCVMGTRGFNRVIIASAGIYLTKSAGDDILFDLTLNPSSGVQGIAVRSRFVLAGTVGATTITNTFYVPADVACTINTRLNVVSLPVTAGTSGGGDLNFIRCVAIPNNGPIVPL